MHGLGSPHNICEWSVRYKKIDFGSHDPAKILTRGLTRGRIVAQEQKQLKARKMAMKLNRRNAEARTKESNNVFSSNKPFVPVDSRTKRKSKEWKSREWERKEESVVDLEVTAEEETDGFEFLETESKRQQEGQK
jgi:hypothetical protein